MTEDGPPAQPIIRLLGVTKSYPQSYPRQGGRFTALADVSLDIGRGSVHGIAGFSGAGKSTLLRTINLLERPDSGSVLVNGEDLTVLSERALRARRRKISMVFQEFNLLANRTVAENVELPLVVAGEQRAARRSRALEALASVGLTDKARSYPERLSGGQKQRVGIARALVTEPDVLLCDEATSALDPRTTDEILELLRGINTERGITVVVVTHEVHVINAVCDRVSAFDAFTDPSGLFSKKWKSIQDLPDGAVVTAHVEPANFYRPFLMLQDAGLIKLRPGVDPLSITENDIIDNPRHLKIQGTDYALLPKALDDADAGFLYASQAADIGVEFHNALVTESKQNQSPDVIAVKSGQQDSAKIKVLKEAYQSDAVKEQLRKSFGGKEVVIPAW